MGRIRFAALLVVLAGTAAAQYTSGIEGTVFDQSGSAIPAAHVRVMNEATGVARTSEANGSGYFRVAELGPGAYRVEVEAPGFRE